MQQYRPQNKKMNLMLNQGFEYQGAVIPKALFLKATIIHVVKFLAFLPFSLSLLSIKQSRIKPNSKILD